MSKHAETFYANNVCKLVIVIFIQFQNKNFWYTFRTLFARKRGLAHFNFLYENESHQYCISNKK